MSAFFLRIRFSFSITGEISLSFVCEQMAIIFNEECLQDVEAPCVAQSFLNHNALLYKIFVVGSRQFVVQRPSLKNMYPGSKCICVSMCGLFVSWDTVM